LVWIAESDDFAEATFLEELVPPMVKDKDITLGFCQSVLFNDGEEITRVANSKKLKSVYRGRDFICKRLFGGNGIPNASMAIFRRSAAASISLDEIAMRYCGDWYFWVVLCQKGKILESGRYLNYFRRHEGNVSGGATKDGLDFLEGDEVFKLVLDTCSPSPEEIAAARECRRAYYYICRNQYDKSTDLKVKESLRRIGINKVGSPSILVRNIKDILRRSAAKFQNLSRSRRFVTSYLNNEASSPEISVVMPVFNGGSTFLNRLRVSWVRPLETLNFSFSTMVRQTTVFG
jgi:hypothetical protein